MFPHGVEQTWRLVVLTFLIAGGVFGIFLNRFDKGKGGGTSLRASLQWSACQGDQQPNRDLWVPPPKKAIFR